MLLHPYFDEYHWTGFREQNLIAEELFEFSGLDCLDGLRTIIDGYEIVEAPDIPAGKRLTKKHAKQSQLPEISGVGLFSRPLVSRLQRPLHFALTPGPIRPHSTNHLPVEIVSVASLPHSSIDLTSSEGAFPSSRLEE